MKSIWTHVQPIEPIHVVIDVEKIIVTKEIIVMRTILIILFDQKI